MVNAISMIINGEPVTLYEVQKYSHRFKVSMKEAIDILIREKLEDVEIKKMNIEAEDFEVNEEMEKIAAMNSITIFEFSEMLQQKGISLEEYKKDIAKKIKKEKLYRKIARAKIERATDEDMKKYYKKNINDFSVPNKVEVARYISPSKDILKSAVKNPMLVSENVIIKEEILESKNINPKLLYIVNETKESSFTPIIKVGSNYMTFYIKKKMDVRATPYQEAKKSIFNKIMNDRQKRVIKEYFDKKAAEAQVVVLRSAI